MDRLSNKGAVVTGAAGGIGSAIAKEFAREGARVVCIDIDGDAVKTLAELIVASGGVAWSLRSDVTVPSEVDAALHQSINFLEKVDVLCTTVGGTSEVPFLDIEPDVWNFNVDLNLTSVFLCARAFGRHMSERNGGAIVVTSSQLGQVGRKGMASYCSAKGGVNQLIRVIALELAQFGVRANAISPGPTATPLMAQACLENPGMYDELVSLVPLQRLGEPEDMAHAATFLASDESSFVTGTTLVVDGGFVAA